MLKGLERYPARSRYHNHRFVMIEKQNPVTYYVLNALRDFGWDTVQYMDKYIIMMSNSKTKQIILAGFTTRSFKKGLDGCAPFGSLPNTNETVTMIILLEINFRTESITMKFPDFETLNTNALFQYSKIIKSFKERVKEYDTGKITHNGLNKFLRKHKNKINLELSNYHANLIREREKHYVC